MDLTSLALAGRIIVGAIFIVIGARLLLARRPVAVLLARKGLPSPAFIVVAGGLIEIVLGLAAVLGVALPAVFLAMIAFVVAATLMVHDFWRQQGMARAVEVNTVLTHALVCGGLLVMAAYPW